MYVYINININTNIYIYICIHMYIEGHDVMMSFVEHECRFLKVN